MRTPSVDIFSRATGARPDPKDRRDFEYGPAVMGMFAPAVIDRRELATPVGDQGIEGSCVGWAVDGALRMIRCKRMGITEELSARWAYERAKENDPFPGEAYDGSTLRAGCSGARKTGICHYSLFPYFEYNTNCMEPEAPDDALSRRISSYVRIRSWRAVKDAIWRNGAVATVMRLHLGWADPVADMVIYRDGDKLDDEYFHAVSIEGYDDPRRLVLTRNSWGLTWGKDGYAWLDLQDFLDNSIDIWTINL